MDKPVTVKCHPFHAVVWITHHMDLADEVQYDDRVPVTAEDKAILS